MVPGNNGLKDQLLALKWIKDNIEHFGGNPDSITLTGLSAGAVSVHYHYLSPLSKGLFHRGFSQSGTVLQSWSLAEKPLETANQLAEHANCKRNTTKETIACMKQLKDKDLVKSIKNLFVFIDSFPFAPFAPVIEKAGERPFLKEHPYKMLQEGKLANDVPWVTSNTADEGLFAVGVFAIFRKLPEVERRWDELMPVILDFYNTVEKTKQEEVARKIKEFYIKSDTITPQNVSGLVQVTVQ